MTLDNVSIEALVYELDKRQHLSDFTEELANVSTLTLENVVDAILDVVYERDES